MKKRLTAAVLCLMLLAAAGVPAAAGDEAEAGAGAAWRKVIPSESLFAVFDGSLWGYADDTGNAVVAPRFRFARPFSGGLALTETEEKGKTRLAYIDETGAVAVDVSALYGDVDSAGDFSSGLAPLYPAGSEETVYIDKTGKEVLTYPAYAGGFHEGLAAVSAGNGFGYIDETGAMAIAPRFGEAWDFYGGYALVRQNGLFGVIDKTGAYVLSPRFEDVRLPEDAAARPLFSDGLAAVKMGGEWGAVDRTGAFAVPARWDALSCFENGFAVCEKDGKKGLIDSAGRLVTDVVYEDATVPINGQAFLKLGGRYGLYELAGMTEVSLDTAGWTGVVWAGSCFVYEKDGLYGFVKPEDRPSSWAAAEVSEAVSLGLVPEDMQNGYARNITRAEVCGLVSRLVEKKTGTDMESYARQHGAGDPAFSDTADGTVLSAARLGIVNGRPGGVFDPGAYITREEAAAILARTAALLSDTAPAQPADFSDAGEISAWAAESVGFVSSNGIMSGSGGAFYPKAFYTREQAYLTFLRLYGTLEKAA